MRYDVLVAGAGPGGCTAAIAAARLGRKVLLIEKNGYPGGMNTAALVCPIMAFHAGKTQVVAGLAQEIIDRLAAKGATLGHLPDPLGVASTITPVDPYVLRIVYFEMLTAEPNITLLFNTFICGADTSPTGITRVTVVNKGGFETFQAARYIDATGDGDLAFLAKAEYEIGRDSDSLMQPMTMLFKLGGVDLQAVREYMSAHPEQFILDEGADLGGYLAVSGFFNLVEKGKKDGRFTIPRDRVLFFQGLHPGEVLVNTSRIIKLSGVSAPDLTRAEIEGYCQADEITSFFRDYIPGFSGCYIVSVGDTIGVRETRRIKCRKKVTAADIKNEAAAKEGVAVCAFPIDIHDPNGSDLEWVCHGKDFCYDIPFGAMLPLKLPNLLVTGRCISASHEALASARISSTVMALGQAAGTAASISIEDGVPVADIDVSKLQSSLRAQGAIPTKADVL